MNTGRDTNSNENQQEHAPKSQPEHLQPVEASENVDLSTQLERVTNALLVPGGNPVQELQQLDNAFAEAGESADTFVDLTARRLLQQQDIFENLNFQSSLVSGGSTFFGLVIRKMGELIASGEVSSEQNTLPIQIRLVEQYRRSGEFEKMAEFAAQVTEKITEGVDADDPLALAQLAKVRYEQSMGAYVDKDFDAAIALGNESADLCKRANDVFGALAARGNVAGVFSYNKADALGEEDPAYHQTLSEGRATLEADLAVAQENIAQTEGAKQQGFVRVESNNTMHLMQIAKRTNNLELAKSCMETLEKNAVFQSGKDQAWTQPYYAILAELAEKHAS